MLFKTGMERIKELDTVSKIEKLLSSEEYGINRPVIDIENISQNIFNLKCIDCPPLTNFNHPSLLIKNRNLILLNPMLTAQERKIEITRQLVTNFYYANAASKNKLILTFLLPEYIYRGLKQQNLTDELILERIGFSKNKFMEKEIKYYNKPEHFSSIIKNAIADNIKKFFIA